MVLDRHALLHSLFMLLELFPWASPFLLSVVSKRLPVDERFTPHQRDLVATIVHNAAIYNGILAAPTLSRSVGCTNSASM